MPIEADRPDIGVERESALHLREERAARVGVVHLHGRELRQPRQQGPRALDQSRMIGRDPPHQAQGVLLSPVGGLPSLLPGRREDQGQGQPLIAPRPQRDEHEEDVPEADLRQRVLEREVGHPPAARPEEDPQRDQRHDDG